MDPNLANLQTSPRPAAPFIGMWIGFLYILFFVTLYFSSFAIAGILHTWVDNAVPLVDSSSPDYSDPLFFMLYFGYEDDEIMRGYIATTIVSMPIFVILAVWLYSFMRKFPSVKLLRSRKILIYITLVGTFLVLLSNIIYALFNLLGGEFTMNFFGHLFVTLFISGTIFFYFFKEVTHDQHPIT